MAEGNGETTIIGADSHIEGKMSFERTAKINGKFDGEITGKGELQVSQDALCKADSQIGAAAVDGRVEGNINAGDTVKLNESGAVRGDITAAKMVMAEGASFHGMCAVGPDTQQEGTARGGQGGAQGGTQGGGRSSGGAKSAQSSQSGTSSSPGKGQSQSGESDESGDSGGGNK